METYFEIGYDYLVTLLSFIGLFFVINWFDGLWRLFLAADRNLKWKIALWCGFWALLFWVAAENKLKDLNRADELLFSVIVIGLPWLGFCVKHELTKPKLE